MTKYRNHRTRVATKCSACLLRLIAAVLALGGTGATAFAQSALSRGPSINSINVGPRGPNLNIGVGISPSVRYSPNLNSSDGPPIQLQSRTRIYDSGPPQEQFSGDGPARRVKKNTVQQADRRFVAREVVIEIDGSPTDADIAVIARRHRLTSVQSQNFPLIGSTLFRWRIPDNRSVTTVVAELVADNTIKSAQPNYRFTLQQAVSAPSEGDPAQYALSKLRLPEAHTLARGDNVAIAVIDSGIDIAHLELSGRIAASFDALGSKEGVHLHGTGIAGVIASHSRLMGSSPSANILAIRAFGGAAGNAESTSFIILKSIDFAVSHGARIINMSFAGPEDFLVSKELAAAAAKGIVLVAASGNAGAKSPPLFPAADRHVIAVTAIDASDKLFAASNRGSHVAIAAPGVDILTPAPDGKYQVTSGTSFAAAYISGLAALMIERNPALKPEDVRSILTETAQDLGAAGRDDLYGAGKADAFKAVSAASGMPIAAASGPAASAGSNQPAASR